VTTFYEYMMTAPPVDVLLETLELSHPSWSQEYLLIRNDCLGRTLVTEEGPKDFIFLPINLKRSADKGDLDKSVTVDLGDLGELIPREIERMEADDSLGVSPRLVYRGFSSVSGDMVYGPLILEVKVGALGQSGARLEAGPKSVNTSRTGLSFTVETIPPIRAFL
jgi:hypothetical protein